MNKTTKIESEFFCLKGSDIVGQMNMLRMGYLGFKMEMDSNDFNIYYGIACDC